jgi:hypothetical protein
MLWLFQGVLIALAIWVGAAAGVVKAWLAGPPPPTVVRYCAPSTADAGCVAARARLAASAARVTPRVSAEHPR